MLRRRAIKLLFLLLVVGAVLRLSGVVEIPAGWFVAGVAIELLLAWIEAAILIGIARRRYRHHRRTHPPFEALLETLRDIEPAPLFAVMEKELRLWRAAYVALTRRRLRQRAP